MKGRKIAVLLFILLLTACSNNEEKVDATYKEMQYSIIRGLNASQEGKYSVAIGHFMKAYAINPNEIYTLRELAYNYGASGDYTMAEKYYLEALKVAPNDEKVVFNLGTIYFNKKKFTESLAIVNKIDITNANTDIKSLRAYNLYELGQYEEAYKILKDIENLKTDDLYYAKVYGDVLLKTGRLGELHPYITKLYKEKSENPEIVYLYGKHLNYNLGKTKEAFEAFDRYIIDYGVYKELNLEAANIACDIEKYDLGKKYLDLLPDKIKYEESYLITALRVYTGLKNQEKIKELTTALKTVKKD